MTQQIVRKRKCQLLHEARGSTPIPRPKADISEIQNHILVLYAVRIALLLTANCTAVISPKNAGNYCSLSLKDLMKPRRRRQTSPRCHHLANWTKHRRHC